MVATLQSRREALNFGTVATNPNDPMQVIEAAGGRFDLEKVSLASLVPGANDDLHCVRRLDTGAIIGQVGNSYVPLSNEEFFVPLASALVEQTGAKIERFAQLGNGNRAFMRLRWDDNLQVGNRKVGDIIGRRITLTTGHDGKFAGKALLEMIRLACLNGMTIPVGDNEWTVVHSRNGHVQLDDIVRLVPQMEDYTRSFTAATQILIDTPVTSVETARKIIASVVDTGGKAGKTNTGDDNAQTQKIDEVVNLFERNQPGAGRAAMKGTGYGLFNALTDFAQHGKKRDNEASFRSMLPGGGGSRNVLASYKAVVKGLDLSERIKAAVAMN